MKGHDLQALEKTPTKIKALKFHSKLNFNNFQERKNEKFLGRLLEHFHH